MSRPILVGVDGSTASEHAADYAARHAVLAGVGLRLVRVYRFPPMVYGMGMPYYEPFSEQSLRNDLTGDVVRLAGLLHGRHPALGEVTTEVVGGVASAVLRDSSAEARLTVLGSRGRGGFPGLRLGSVAQQVAVHGNGPILIVHEDDGDRADRPVVVGHDGSPGADLALRFAADEAALRAVPLRIVRRHRGARPQDHADAAFALDAVADRLRADRPDLKIEVRAVARRSPAAELVAASEEAALTVVGARGLGGFAGLLLGSTSQALAHDARGPVAVVHPDGSHH